MEEFVDKLLKQSFRENIKDLEGFMSLTRNFYEFEKIKIYSRAESARKVGNELFLTKYHTAEVHKEILSHYNRSMAVAPMDSDALAFAFGNRSAFLKHCHKYEECINDVDKALEVVEKLSASQSQSFETFKIKLLCRKVECLKLLGVMKYKKILADVTSCVDNMDDPSNKTFISKLVNAAKDTPFQQLKVKKQNQDCIKDEYYVTGVSVNYDEKYGRHLVSTKDFKPGDIIFIEKPYAAILDFKTFTNCNNCYVICWSAIPCEYCSWVIYCSKTCRSEAWKKHHELECDAVPNLRYRSIVFTVFGGLPFRLLCQAIKEAGSITLLRTSIEKLEANSADLYKKKCLENGNIKNTFESIFSLITHLKENDQFYNSLRNQHSFGVWIAVISLLKFTTFFKSDFLTQTDDLIKNENIYFVAKLLLKLCIIQCFNAHEFAGLADDCNIGTKTYINSENATHENACISALTSLLNHSCFPNVSHIITAENGTLLTYALRPIKQNTQLFSSYTSNFAEENFLVRMKQLDQYNFICNCLACANKWPPVFLKIKEGSALLIDKAITNETDFRIYMKCSKVIDAWIDKDYAKLNKSSITTISKAIDEFMKVANHPSAMLSFLTFTLSELMDIVYGRRRIKFDIGC